MGNATATGVLPMLFPSINTVAASGKEWKWTICLLGGDTALSVPGGVLSLSLSGGAPTYARGIADGGLLWLSLMKASGGVDPGLGSPGGALVACLAASRRRVSAEDCPTGVPISTELLFWPTLVPLWRTTSLGLGCCTTDAFGTSCLGG